MWPRSRHRRLREGELEVGYELGEVGRLLHHVVEHITVGPGSGSGGILVNFDAEIEVVVTEHTSERRKQDGFLLAKQFHLTGAHAGC